MAGMAVLGAEVREPAVPVAVWFAASDSLSGAEGGRRCFLQTGGASYHSQAVGSGRRRSCG
jgi:hypothetical protein